MPVCIEEYRSSIGKNLSSGPCACNTVVNAMHLYSFEDTRVSLCFTFFLATPAGVADSCNYLYSFISYCFTFLLATRETPFT